MSRPGGMAGVLVVLALLCVAQTAASAPIVTPSPSVELPPVAEIPDPSAVAPGAVVTPAPGAAPAPTPTVPVPVPVPDHAAPAAAAQGAVVQVPPAAAPRRRVVALVRSIPATPIANAEPVAAVASRPADGDRPRQPEIQEAGGVPQVVSVLFGALSATVGFVPTSVWVAIGGLAALALALLGLAIARDRKVRALGRERESLLADLQVLEGAVLPAVPEALGGLALSVTTRPATGPATGGDFHDAFPLSQDRVAVIVGDVTGNGHKALADAQFVRHAVRAYLEAGLDPRSAIAMTGAVVDERDEPLFASVLVAVHDRSSGTLTFASAGHEPLVFVDEQGAGLAPVTGWSPPLGAGLETGRRQTSMPLPEGSAVCLLTDGVTEALSDGERIGVSRVTGWLSALGPGAMSSDVVARLQAEAQAEDDVTICMLRALTPATKSAPRLEEAIVEGGDPTYLVRFLRDCGLPAADAKEAGEVLAAMPDGTRLIASVEIRGGRAVVELVPLRGATSDLML